MKKSILFLTLTLVFTVACASQENNNTQPAPTEQKATENKTTATENTPTNTANTNPSTASSEIVKRGTALGNTTLIQIGQIMENPKSYEGKTLTVEGKIARVCQAKGCWMELTEKEGDPGMRITFKDYGFFVPTDSQGKKVKAEGQLELKVMPKDQVEHLVSEGSKLKVNPDGTANTISLVASGVEVYSAN
jgi:Domain of unknown function (DUF4920)